MPHRSVRTINNSNSDEDSFQIFLEGWLVRQEHFLDELQSAETNIYEKSNHDLQDLIERVLTHYQQYYEAKSLATKQDVYLVLSPIWFTSLERTFLWISGFKPGLIFKLVTHSVSNLSEDQLRKIDTARSETQLEENEVENDLARIQESVAAPPLLDLARRSARLVDGERIEVESAIGVLKSSMEILVERADLLRAKAAMKVLEILEPVQIVKFLAAAAKVQLRLRSWGLRRDGERRR